MPVIIAGFAGSAILMDASVIDAFEFCRLRQSQNGEAPISNFPRLAEESAANIGSLSWSLTGDLNQHGHSQLTLVVSGVIELMCQRCLTPFEFHMESNSVLVIAKDDESANAIESLLDDDAIDVIVALKLLNVSELVEDEALLAIPLSPKHDVCPDAVMTDMPKESTKAPSPFDALKNWKQ